MYRISSEYDKDRQIDRVCFQYNGRIKWVEVPETIDMEQFCAIVQKCINDLDRGE